MMKKMLKNLGIQENLYLSKKPAQLTSDGKTLNVLPTIRSKVRACMFLVLTTVSTTLS